MCRLRRNSLCRCEFRGTAGPIGVFGGRTGLNLGVEVVWDTTKITQMIRNNKGQIWDSQSTTP